ncbi:hypothetical protein [Bordetella sp. BOR01]|uniref:hypothetical protein n=1 Tax=Bordetella sp. BOR01 TaxID=2854779 RepID=UPI001C4394B2|nr:hypothetical protein [Bordetella sp. BOR01]MBV7481794.1 hypothetical protein [Bordetella sp. BOR01]
MSKSKLDELTDELLGYQETPGPDGPVTPTMSDVSELASHHDVSLSESEKSLESLITSFGSSQGIPWLGTSTLEAPVQPEDAAQALVAGVNAASGGTLLPPGLEFKRSLTATVHDFVNVEFKSSHFKNTLGNTTYQHTGNVEILAKDVRLSAKHIRINSTIERNTVTVKKESYRYINNLSAGSWSGLYTSDSNNTATAVAGDLSWFINFSAGAVRLGTALAMGHHGDVRNGVRLLEIDTERSKADKKAYIGLTLVSAIGLFL